MNLEDFKVGDMVWGRVTEQLANGELIISFEGDLLRVANETNKRFYIGETVILTVSSQNPLIFKLAKHQKSRREPGKFDVTI